MLAVSIMSAGQISIHAPAKGATQPVIPIQLLCVISIHAPAKGATEMDHHDCPMIDISIHAPAKGATRHLLTFANADVLFQSTLPRRERLKLTHEKDVAQLFQSTLPRRERQGGFVVINTGNVISIHAPAKGATQRRK